MKKLFSLFLLALFLIGLVPVCSLGQFPAAGKTKKKVSRPAKRAKKKAKAIKAKKTVKVKKAKKIPAKKRSKPAGRKASRPSGFALPSRTGVVSQRYSLEEGIGDSEADKVINELKALGVIDAGVNVATNTLSVKFNSATLSSIGVIKKLKELGYTVKRIN